MKENSEEESKEELKPLNDRQIKFCEEYVIDWNGSRAAREAGYSEDSVKQIASENLTKPNIKKYIEDIQKDLGKLAGISALFNINHLKDIVTESMKAGDKDILINTPKDRIKALEVINKMLGMNEPERHDITSDGDSISPIQWVKNDSDK